MTKLLTDKRYIIGLLREVEVLGGCIRIASNGEHALFPFSIISKKNESGDSEYALGDFPRDITGEQIEISFELTGHVYSGSSKRIEKNVYGLPDSLAVLNMRSEIRVRPEHVAESEIFAELRGLGWRKFCTVVDFSPEYIAVKSNMRLGSDLVKSPITVRMFSGSQQILSHGASVAEGRLDDDNSYHYVLHLGPNSSQRRNQLERRHSKRELTRFSNTLVVRWPSQNGYKINGTIIDVAASGFKVELHKQPIAIPLGSIVFLDSVNIFGQVVWRNANAYGISICISGEEAIRTWHGFVESYEGSSLENSPNIVVRNSILRSLLKSGYLADTKAALIKNEKGYMLVVPMNEKTNKWIYRSTKRNEQELSSHISYLKIVDTCWLIQELGNASVERGTGKKTIEDSIVSFYNRESHFSNLNSFLLSLYDKKIKFNQRFWTALSSKLNLPTFQAYVSYHPMNLKELSDAVVFNDSITFEHPDLDQWNAQFRDLSKIIDSNLLSSLGLYPHDFRCSELLRNISESGYSFERNIIIARSQGICSAVLVNFGLPTYSNLTVTANHLWIAAKNLSSALEALSALMKDDFGRQSLFGVTQLVIVTETEDANPKLKSMFRDFSLMLSPIKDLIKIYGGSDES